MWSNHVESSDVTAFVVTNNAKPDHSATFCVTFITEPSDSCPIVKPDNVSTFVVANVAQPYHRFPDDQKSSHAATVSESSDFCSITSADD